MTGDDTLDEFGRWAETVSPSYAATLKLDLVLNRDRVGTVMGVEFDFRHPDLPGPEAWHAPEGAYPFGVAFPWDRELAGGAVDAFVTGHNDRSPVLHVYPGDKVSIARVRRFHRGGYRPPYIDDHDSHALWAYLSVCRPDGSLASAEEPISFNAREAMGPHSPHIDIDDDGYADFVGDFRVTFDKVAQRIRRLFHAAPDRADEWLRLASQAAREARNEAEYVAEGLNFDPAQRQSLEELLDLTAAAAYALAKAETEPVIRKAFNRTRPATMARRTRTDPIRLAAREHIGSFPNTSQTACAAAIAVKLGKDQRQVERAISGLFTWKQLHGGGREKRPRV